MSECRVHIKSPLLLETLMRIMYRCTGLGFAGSSQLHHVQESLCVNDRTNLSTLPMRVEGISTKRASRRQTIAHCVHHSPGCHSGLFKAHRSRPVSDCHWQPQLAAPLYSKMEERHKSHSQSRLWCASSPAVCAPTRLPWQRPGLRTHMQRCL